MFDYLASFVEDKDDQMIGLGEPLLITVWYMEYPSPPGEPSVKKWTVSFSEKTSVGNLLYDPIDPRKDPRFSSESWAALFTNKPGMVRWSYKASIDIDTLKVILEHCNRISQIKAFW